ncbi:MAG: hypothetical protein Tp138OMZ00d2C19078241_40 [Prokaryotic dsDNA virus sp.]|jgi:SPP1 gp7 family putative phage head morphogenesis protein|nr:MAG: hypothetical protein Tp138OMZ00d2C19078241_40 [Prokaryotic dsDNA virus sp.]|tara:strand:- start:43525 stop:44457 length:933 start_codon:yes stop_codon:yes gene_type:complete
MQPIAPRSKSNPSGTTSLIRGSEREFRQRLKSVRAGVLRWLDQQNPRVLEANERRVNNRFYAFQLDEVKLADLSATLDQLIQQYIMQRNEFTQRHFMSQYAILGYENGAVMNIENIRQQDAEYATSVEEVITSQPYQDRLAVTSSRVFEEVQGFSADMKADLNRILTDGMSNGFSPRRIAREIRDNMDTQYSRAKRIARTEINNAHRQAIYDEDRRADALGVRTMLMHISALIPGRTRRTHAERHGWVGTREQEAEWYAEGGNAINCLCTPLSILVDRNGNPISKKFVERQLKKRKAFLSKKITNNCCAH